MPRICTPCGGEIPGGTQSKYLAIGRMLDGRLRIEVGCDHRPIEDAQVYCGSLTCARKQLATYSIQELNSAEGRDVAMALLVRGFGACNHHSNQLQ